MKKKFNVGKIFPAGILISALCLMASVHAYALEAEELVPIGNTVGIQMKTDGVMIVGFAEVVNDGGIFMPADDAGLKAGDKIISIGSHQITSANDFLTAAAEFDGSPISVKIIRDGKQVQFTVTPQKNKDGAYQLGLWLRDGMSGVGTVTFYDPATGVYGALGHGINDIDTGELMSVTDGIISSATIVDIIKGAVGTPGELCGKFDGDHVLGTIDLNSICGIFGTTDKMSGTPIPVACEDEVKLGKATIMCNVNGQDVKEYDVEISRVYRNSGDNRFLMLTVTDPELLALTGGIVQGMSGSPIIQDGKLIGAVTHVLVSDPTRGYGIFIKSMMDAVGGAQQEAA